jgi:hypothetical protein
MQVVLLFPNPKIGTTAKTLDDFLPLTYTLAL